jgi:hypothetical protein
MVAAAAAMATATAAEVYLWRVLVVVVGWRAMNKVSQSIDQIWCVAAEGVTHCLRQARQAGVAAVMVLAGGARCGGAAVVLLAVCLFAVQFVFVLQVHGRCK